MNVQIIIPVFNPDDKFRQLLLSLQRQTLTEVSILIIDSGSAGIYRKWLWDKRKIAIKGIEVKNFNHGGTRQMGINMFPDNDIYVFLTQDAVLEDDKSLEKIVNVFANDKVGCAYGRQIPHKDANLFASIARTINYPKESYIRSFNDKHKYGMKTAFISNSFAAYRREAMINVGGFPVNTILSEDMWVAARMLMQGWQIAYVADARVYHSHNYTMWQEFKRYFDIGVFHAREYWIRKNFGEAGSAGYKFIAEEIRLISKQPVQMQIKMYVEMLLRDSLKLIGYKLGKAEGVIPRWVKRRLSISKDYWG